MSAHSNAVNRRSLLSKRWLFADLAQFDAGDHGRGLSGICFSERGCSAWLRPLELRRTPGEPMGLLFGAAGEPLGWLGLWSVLDRG